MLLTRDVAKRVLDIVDQGLSNGLGNPIPGQMCVEAAVCYALGLPHGDDPQCVSPALRALKIKLNDLNWSSPAARAKGMRRLAIMQLGTAGTLDEKQFLSHVVDMTIRKVVPRALRSAIALHPDPAHKDAMEAAAVKCIKEGDKSAADAAYAAADAAYAAARAVDAAAYAARAAAYAAADAAYAAARAAAYAAAYAARAAAYAAAYAARAAAYAAAYAARAAAYAAADAVDAADAARAVDAAADAARAAAYAAADAGAYDKELAFFAEEIVQILIAMDMPAKAWIDLTE